MSNELSEKLSSPKSAESYTQSEIAQLGSVAIGSEGYIDNPNTFPDGVVTADEFISWAQEQGFGNNKRGTMRNETSFLYVKNCHHLGSIEEVEPALAAMTYLTSKGVLNPETKWGALKSREEDGGGYQLFAMSPKIEAFQLDEHFDTDFAEDLLKPETQEGSPELEWMRRVDPSYQPGQSIESGSLLNLLNRFEASHPENWGRDDSGQLFPIDVEVISISGRMDLVKEWYAQQPQPEI